MPPASSNFNLGEGGACEILYKLASIGFVLVSAKVTFPRGAGSSFSSGRSGKAVHQKPLSYAAQLAVTVPTASIERRACSVASPLAEKITRRADIYKWFSERNRACGARSHHSLPQPFLPPSLPPFHCTIRGEPATDSSRCNT